MITDLETNFVYFSKTLKQEKYSTFLKRLTEMLKNKGIRYDFLSYTNDIWCRDYMPIQISKNKFVQFRYDPTYPPITDAAEACKDIRIKHKISDIKVDGGNIVKSRTKAIMTERVIIDNKRHYPDRYQLIEKLKEVLEVEQVIMIPEDPDDLFGHADGMVRFCDGVKDERNVFVNDYCVKEAALKRNLYVSLEKKGLIPIPMPYNPIGVGLDARGIYINYLQVGKTVFYPTYGLPSDKIAKKFFSKYFGSNAVTIKADEIAIDGGILNCVSWNIVTKRSDEKETA